MAEILLTGPLRYQTFSKGSESTGALDAIWLDFDDFQSKAAANIKAALQLEQAAGSEDAGRILAAVQKLSETVNPINGLSRLTRWQQKHFYIT